MAAIRDSSIRDDGERIFSTEYDMMPIQLVLRHRKRFVTNNLATYLARFITKLFNNSINPTKEVYKCDWLTIESQVA